MKTVLLIATVIATGCLSACGDGDRSKELLDPTPLPAPEVVPKVAPPMPGTPEIPSVVPVQPVAPLPLDTDLPLDRLPVPSPVTSPQPTPENL